jgi:multidrug resistance efflux pump
MKAVRRIMVLIPVTVGVLLVAFALLVWIARIEEVVETTGYVRIERFQIVRPGIDGAVARVLAEPGQRVRRGDLLVELESFNLEREAKELESTLIETRLNLAAARGQGDLDNREIQPQEISRQKYEVAQIDLEEQRVAAQVHEIRLARDAAQNNLKRAEELAKYGLISDQDLQTARNNVEQFDWRIRQAELSHQEMEAHRQSMGEGLGLLGSQHRQRSTESASKVGELAAKERWLRSELARLQERLEQRSLRATLDGWVTGPVYHELIGRQVTAGQELMTVIDDKSVRFISLVPEESVVRVRPGQPASVEIAGLPRRRFDVFKGAVVAVEKRPVVGEAQGKIFYQADIDLSRAWVERGSERFYLRDGMRGTAEIVYRPNVRLLRSLFDFVVGREE